MPLFKVTETKVVTLVHVYEAKTAKDAIGLMQSDTTKGLMDILEDDFEKEYEVKKYSIKKWKEERGY